MTSERGTSCIVAHQTSTVRPSQANLMFLPARLQLLLDPKQVVVRDAVHLLDVAQHDPPGVQPGDDVERLRERRLVDEHGMLGVDQALTGEEIELADPHRQHGQVAASQPSGGGDQPLSSSIATSSRRPPSVSSKA